jgi:hypothetical protein
MSTLLASYWAQIPTFCAFALCLSRPAVAQTTEEDTDPPTVTVAAGQGITVTAADDSASMTVKGRVQIRDTVAIAPDNEVTNELNVRTYRLHMLGHVLNPDVRYGVQLAFGPNEFEATSPSPIFDAFIDLRHQRDASVKIGQYFVPFDRARTIKESMLQFVDRQQMVTELNLDRDVGITVYSQDLFGLDGMLNYALGVFGGQGRNRALPEEMGFLYTARIGVKPFGAFDDDSEGDLKRLDNPRLALGVVAGYNQNTNRVRSTTGATYLLGTFDYRHAAADAVFKFRGLSVIAEALYRTSPRDSRTGLVDGEPVTEWTRSGWGYMGQAGFMLTDHIEIVGRYDQLFYIGDTDPALIDLVNTQGRETGLGFNVYLNGHSLKIQADHAMRFADDIALAQHFARLQLDVSF